MNLDPPQSIVTPLEHTYLPYSPLRETCSLPSKTLYLLPIHSTTSSCCCSSCCCSSCGAGCR
jgi:hypothetical protein